MSIDGSQINNNVDVWKNTVTVAGNTTYHFSFWLASVYTDPPQSFSLEVLIDGSVVQTFVISQPAAVWQQYSVSWFSAVPKTIQISLRQKTAGLFRDFGLDDISFKCLPCQAEFIPEILSQCGNVQFVNNSTGTAPFSWFWDFGDGFTSTLANPTHQYAQCGTYNVCLFMNGAGCMDTVCQTVTIFDNTPPTALCDPIGVELDSNCTALLSPGLIDAGSSDNCAIDSMYVSPAILTGCDIFPVTLTVVDWCGNTSTCTTSVQTIEVVPPVIVCPPNITLACDNDLTPSTTGFATATDNCTLNPIMSYTDNAFGFFPCDGWIERTWTAMDSCENESSCTQTIIVIDNLPPVLTQCNGDTTLTGTFNAQGVCEASIVLQSPVATDNCDQSVQLTNSFNTTADASGTYPQGTTTVTWTAVDDCMNSATCSFSVTVQCDSCCTDFDLFCENVLNAISTTINNDSCKASLSIGNLPGCDYLEYINWGDGQQNTGPFAAGDMAMHTYGGAGTYEICFLAIEKDSNGFICFEKYLCDTITLNCGTCIDPPPGLVAWWPMDDVQGDPRAVDTSGTHDALPNPNGMIGFTDGPDPVPGKVDGALHFAGVPGAYYLEVPDDPSLNFGNNSFSIDAWIKTDMGTQTEPIVDKLGSLNNGYSLSIQGSTPSTSRLTLLLGTGTSVQYLQGPAIIPGQWNLVAVTVGAATATFYVCNANGFNQVQVPITPYNASNTLPMLIGNNPSNPHWDITIDELELFNRQLT
ncbi:MAG: PKD domain-containing protein, partial [Gammaproteobacteria bacterium]